MSGLGWVGAALATTLVGACTAGTSEPRFERVSPTTPLHFTVTTIPAPASDNSISRKAVFVLAFDDGQYPDPDGVGFEPILLRSGTANFDATYKVDLVERYVVVTPKDSLDAERDYELVVSAGIPTLDGRVTTDKVATTFHAGSATDGPPAAPTRHFIDIQRIIACASGCHSTTGLSGNPRNPTRLLNLDTPVDPVYGLIKVPAVGLIGSGPPMMRVAPGDSSRSVLLRKLIGGNPAASSGDEESKFPYPNMRVDGRRMPLDVMNEANTLEPVTVDTLRVVRDWIDQGAIYDPPR